MENTNKQDNLAQAKKELEKIEKQKSSWKNKFIMEQEIWQEIAMQINSYTGEEQKLWIKVMDLYQEKYRNSNK